MDTFGIGILGDLDATAIAEKIQKKEFSAQEAVECAIERAKNIDPIINAIVYDDFPAAKENSKTKQTGIFAGVPTFIKDLNDVKGMPTLKGSSAYKIVEAKKK
ncbi:MAG: hypothetical protein IPO64_12935 [Bacteroidetes bacterium]|nr:hypothetical protein [Bacteroidota bacterium]